MSDKHLSTHFDAELAKVSSKLLEMGGLVEAQVSHALAALINRDIEQAELVISTEPRINSKEVEIDADCANIMARRQPTARDLRLLLAITKTITNLERVGDEANRIAKMAKNTFEQNKPISINFSELKIAGDLALQLLRRSLDAFARLDTVEAAAIVRDDDAIDDEFRSFVRKLITFLMEDPRIISVGLDLLFVAKAIERIGDHAKNIAEFIIYIVKGTDVRHTPLAEMEKEALK